MKNITQTFSDKISIFIIIVIITIFYLACYHFSYNFFYQDDFHLLRFVTIFQDNSLSIQQKFQTLYDQHNEHRIIFPRLFVLLGYYFQGHLDWKMLNTVSALYYFGIFIFFFKFVKKIKYPTWYILPIALFIFQPSAHQNFYWTISILQQVGNLFWAMFLFYSLVYFKPSKFGISIILIMVLTFTHGNGLFGFGVGGILLFYQKRYRDLIIWIGIMIVTALLYFRGYNTAQNSNITGSLSNPLQLIGCFGGFWGGFIHDLYRSNFQTIITIFIGLSIFSSLLMLNFKLILNFFLTRNKVDSKGYSSQENLFLLALFTYISITAMLVSLSRSWTSIEAGFQNRYLHNSVISVVVLYVTLLHYKSLNFARKTGILMIIFGVIFNISSWYSTYEFIDLQKKSQEADAINYEINKISIVNDKYFNNNIASMLEKSFKEKISIFPTSDISNQIEKIESRKSSKTTNHVIEMKKDSVLEVNISNSHYRYLYQLNNYSLPYKGDVYVVLKSDKNVFFSATNHRRNAKLSFLKTGQFYTDGFTTNIMVDAMPANEYQIGILHKIGNRFNYFTTKYLIQTK